MICRVWPRRSRGLRRKWIATPWFGCGRISGPSELATCERLGFGIAPVKPSLAEKWLSGESAVVG